DSVQGPRCRVEAEYIVVIFLADVEVSIVPRHVPPAGEAPGRHEMLDERPGRPVILVDPTRGRPSAGNRVEIAVWPERRKADGGAGYALHKGATVVRRVVPFNGRSVRDGELTRGVHDGHSCGACSDRCPARGIAHLDAEAIVAI